MRLRRFFPASALILLWAGAAVAADLAKVDRTIKTEPAYRSPPKYCLLVFGPEAAHRVWLVLDGDVLYVDRNGNGDLTEDGERVEWPPGWDSTPQAKARTVEAGKISVGGLTHADLTVSQTAHRRVAVAPAGQSEKWQPYLDSVWRQVPDGVTYFVSLKLDPRCYGTFAEKVGPLVPHVAWLDEHGHLAFADRHHAPVLHFGGPLTLRVHHVDRLRRGDEPGNMIMFLGTNGHGRGTFVLMHHDLVPKDVHPVAEIRFPPKAPHQAPVTRTYVLKQRC